MFLIIILYKVKIFVLRKIGVNGSNHTDGALISMMDRRLCFADKSLIFGDTATGTDGLV